DFDAKVKCLEELDPFIPEILALEPDVLMIAGDHATPAIMAAHSWHPVPFLLHSKLTKGQGVPTFDEKACALGAIGSIPATSVMVLGLSHAGKMTKFGP
ncbi:MAG: phosphoglycerate mutase, partial [Chloroflexi bacterium]|nr:phosphoglycerate mutase [Chloroflexota bacterium]